MTPSATAIRAATLTDEPPIIVVSTDYQEGQGGKATINLTCLNNKEYNREIDAENVRGLRTPMMDNDENIYVPVWRFGRSDILYVVPRRNSIKQIALNTEEIYSSKYCYGRMLFASSSVNNIVIMEKDFSYRIVKPKTVDPRKTLSIGGIVKGEENKVIAFNVLPVRENEKQFAEVFIIDLNSLEITRRLLPAPPSEEPSEVPLSPTVKYNLIFIGVSQDLKKLYYRYFEAEGNVLYPRLGMFDTENEKELHTYIKSCLCPDGYRQYKEYLFASHVAPAGGSALLLSLKDLSPVVDLYELLKEEETSKVLVSPFGKYFIVGTQNKVFLLSQNGHILKESEFWKLPLGGDRT